MNSETGKEYVFYRTTKEMASMMASFIEAYKINEERNDKETAKFNRSNIGGMFINCFERIDEEPKSMDIQRELFNKFLEERNIKLNPDQEKVIGKLFSIPTAGGKSLLIAMLYCSDSSAQLYHSLTLKKGNGKT